MKIYFSAKQLPGLNDMTVNERLKVIELASKKLTVPEKFLLNLVKLFVLVPAFVLIFRWAKDWSSIGYALVLFMVYPIILRPFQYGVCAQYIPAVLAKMKQQTVETDE